MQVSPAELQEICKKAERWTGPTGGKRKVWLRTLPPSPPLPVSVPPHLPSSPSPLSNVFGMSVVTYDSSVVQIAVCEYKVTDPLDKRFSEVTTHIVIYHIAAIGGDKELYRCAVDECVCARACTCLCTCAFCDGHETVESALTVARVGECGAASTAAFPVAVTGTFCDCTTARSSSCSERQSRSWECRDRR
jgi:hypothetical protein